MNEFKARILLILLLFLFGLYSMKSKADSSIETVFGGLTYHLQDENNVNSLYSNQISNNGSLIYTGLLGIGLSQNNWNGKVFIGENSIAQPIFGAMLSYTWKFGIFRLGPLIGYYQQDDNAYYAKGISPFSVGFGIVPLLGAEFSAKILTFDDDKYVKLNTVITPVIINETVSIGMELW